MADQQKVLRGISSGIVGGSQHHKSPTLDKAGFEHIQNLSSDLVKKSCGIVISTAGTTSIICQVLFQEN